MKLFGLLIALALGQDCPFYAEEESGSFKIWRRNTEIGPTLLFDEASGAILSTGSGNLEIKDFRGQFWESDFTTQKNALAISSTEYKRNSLQINFGENIHLSLNCLDTTAQLVQLAVDAGMDRFWLRFAAGSAEEGVYGGGEQFSYFNLRGKSFQMLTREQGVGRNASELVSFVSERCCRTGGEYHHTYWPQPTCVISGGASRNFYINFWHDEYSVFDLTQPQFHEFEFHVSNPAQELLRFELDFGKDYAETVSKLSLSYGKQNKLPNWVTTGAIVGLQGGTDRVLEIIEDSQKVGDIDIHGVWIQDWSGQIFTDFGDRVFWNWQWNETQYPNLDTVLPEMAEKGVYFLNYLNPHLLNSPTSELYLYGEEHGYFVKNKTTGQTLEQVFGFEPFLVVTVDLSNPEAAEWFKNEVIIKNTIEFGFKGWMADFGEYLPYSDDVMFFDGTSGKDWHNKYSEKWANLNMQALVETGTLGDCFFFSRAGWNGMRASSTVAWAGDQNVDFSYGDGLFTTIPAALSLGASGFGITHFDIGGYTGMPPLIRTEELFLRSAEAAVFTPIMRTHEGNRPYEGFQYYCNICSKKLLGRLVKVHNVLEKYIDFLMGENADEGKPIQRPMIWLEDKEELRSVDTQYYFGDDIVIAPVLRPRMEKHTLYIPEGTWAWVWNSNVQVTGPVSNFEIESPIGYPAAFYRLGSAFQDDFETIQNFYDLPVGCKNIKNIIPNCNDYLPEGKKNRRAEFSYDKVKQELIDDLTYEFENHFKSKNEL
ncbi:unnamed protein product [Oikopleura dioica]|uniref:Glycoside hydrolase family 31 N-terminal domain-containing protein n=1 Tax=Oikopleura dioica TaxID=34765 RepID=E4XME4_OIKDI|nr:unnamed protein product [Oikopleura dioica]